MKNIIAFTIAIYLLPSCMEKGIAIRTQYFPKVELKRETLPKKKNLWVFLLAGQSNMAGRGFVEPQDTIPSDRVLTINKKGEIIVAKEPIHFYESSELGLDCGLSFGKAMLKHIPDSISILLIPTAVGGSRVSQWLDDERHRKVRLLTNFKKKVALGKTYGQIKGILWHQGESDANQVDVPFYKDRLSELFSEFRQLVDDEQLPVLVGELGTYAHRKDYEFSLQINEQIKLLTTTDANAICVKSSDFDRSGYNGHFGSESQRTFGHRFAEEYIKHANSQPIAEASTKKKPNILLIMVDDMGYSDIGCYGGEIQTPNLDKLADEGLRFTRYYNTAKCFPSRACLLTGQYAQNNGMGRNAKKFTNAVTIAEVLREAGYRTLMTGKHHGEENPFHFGFDRYFGLKDGSSNHFNPGLQRKGEVVPAHKKGNFQPREWGIDGKIYAPYTPPEKDFYTTDYFTNYAIDYLEEYKHEDKPFFLYIAYTAPHDPLMAWPEDQQKYLGKYMVGYEAIRKNRYERQKKMGLIDENYPLSDPTYEDWDALSQDEKLVRDSIMATHAAMVDRVDQNIGRILSKLEILGELENTLILFMSDNGAQSQSNPNSWLWAKGKNSDFGQAIGSMGRYTSLSLSWANVSDTPFRLYKSNSHEGGISTPLIMYWKGKIIKPGSINNFPSHLIDIMPTILEASGANYLEEFKGERINPVDGVSLLPATKGIGLQRDEPLFWQWQKGKAIRQGKWKLVSDNNGPWELYDMNVDQTETNDLVDEYPDKANELDKLYNNWIRSMVNYSN